MTLQISELTDSPFGARVSGIDPERISAVSDLRRIHQERLGLLCLEFDQLLSTSSCLPSRRCLVMRSLRQA